MLEQQDDLFDDEPSSQGEGESKTFDEPAKPDPADGKSADDEARQAGEEGQAGVKEGSEPPSEQQEGNKAAKAEKMIPESRFKAALKDASDKLEAAKRELDTFKAQPVPDKDRDPEGYDLHIRMEASKAAMRATHTDYQDVIEHYKEMADANPYLNEAVAKHPVPAQYAYQIAKEDMRIKKLSDLETSDEWKQFQAWKTQQEAAGDNSAQKSSSNNKVGKQLADGGVKVPNLNRATSVSRSAQRSEEDDELFAGAL